MTITIKAHSLDVGFFVNPKDESVTPVIEDARRDIESTFNCDALRALLHGKALIVTVDSPNDYDGFKREIVRYLNSALVNPGNPLKPGVHLMKGKASVRPPDGGALVPLPRDRWGHEEAILSKGDYGGTRCAWADDHKWIDTREITLMRRTGFAGSYEEWTIAADSEKKYFVTACLTYPCESDRLTPSNVRAI